MNIFHKVTLETLKKNRVRTLVTIIGIILSAAMICAVTTFASSILNFMVEDAIYNDGDYYGSTLNVSMDKINEVKEDSRLSTLVMSQSIGYAKLEGCRNPRNPYLYIMGADKIFFNSMPVHMTRGRLPESPSEIILPEHVSSNGGVSLSLGEAITLNIGQRKSDGIILYQNTPLVKAEDDSVLEMLDTTETRAYTIVGFYKKPSFENYDSPGYTAITAMDEDTRGTYNYDIYFKTKNPKEIYNLMNEHSLGVLTNWSLLAYSGASRYDSFYSVLYGMGSIFIALIMFGSISLIYNAFAISVSERTKQFGLLVSIGATKKQIKSSVFYEALVLSLIGIPLGVMGGIGGIGLTLYLLKDKIISLTGSQIPVTLSVSWISVGAAAIIALITILISAWIPSKRAVRINAIDAIRQSSDISAKGNQVKTSKLTYRLFGLEGMIASKYFKRSRRRYRATIVSLFMSIVLFISASSFCMYLTESVSGAMDTYGFDIAYFFSGKENKPFQEIYDELSSVKGVQKAAYADSNSGEFMFSPSCYSQDYLDYIKAQSDEQNYYILTQKPSILHESMCFIEDKVYEDFLKEQKLDVKKYMDNSRPTALVYNKFNVFNTKAGKYYNISILKNETDLELYTYRKKEYEGYSYVHNATAENGDAVLVYRSKETGQDIQLPAEEYAIKNKVNIGSFTEDLPFCVSTDTYPIVFMYPYSAIKTVMGSEYHPWNPSLYFTSSDHNTTYQAMKKILEEDSSYNVESRLENYAAMADRKRNIVTVISVFAYGFIALISLIALANVFNTISTNIALRRREFAMLRSVGMTSRGFNKMMNFECILYGIRSLALGLPVSVGVTYLIYKVVNSGYTTGFHMSWISIGVAIFSVFVVVFSTMMYAMSKIKNDNPIDALRNENL